MNKKLTGAIMLCASLFTLSAAAQDAVANGPQVRTPDGRGREMVGGAPQMLCDSAACSQLFEGINLTAAQKAKLQELQKAQAAKRTSQATEAKADAAKARQDRQAAMKAEKRACLDEIKSVLTADQYVTFLENAFMQQGQRMGMPSQRMGTRQGRPGNNNGGVKAKKAPRTQTQAPQSAQ